MKNFRIKTIVMAIGLSTITQLAVAELNTDRAVIHSDDDTHRVAAHANFATSVSGDLYLATQVNGELLFFANGGQELTFEPVPFASNNEYSGQIPLFDFPAAGIAPGRYPVYQVVTQAGTDPLNFNNWVGGLGGLSVINFNISLPAEISGDFNNDGFADDDHDRDGFHDDDHDQDGFHDDDSDRDGYHDDDHDRDGHTDHDHSDDNNNTNGDAEQGRSRYTTCASSSCHGADPAMNQNHILEARDPSEILEAIQEDKGGMGFLRDAITTSDAQNIAAYLNNL